MTDIINKLSELLAHQRQLDLELKSNGWVNPLDELTAYTHPDYPEVIITIEILPEPHYVLSVGTEVVNFLSYEFMNQVLELLK